MAWKNLGLDILDEFAACASEAELTRELLSKEVGSGAHVFRLRETEPRARPPSIRDAAGELLYAERRARANARYRATEHGKTALYAGQARYLASEKGKAAKARECEKRKAARRAAREARQSVTLPRIETE